MFWGVGDRRKEVAAVVVVVGDAEGAAATSGSRSRVVAGMCEGGQLLCDGVWGAIWHLGRPRDC